MSVNAVPSQEDDTDTSVCVDKKDLDIKTETGINLLFSEYSPDPDKHTYSCAYDSNNNTKFNVFASKGML